jgi:carbonic anhydrase
MSNVLPELIAANQKYAADFGDKAKLAAPPARHFAILTCMDARLDPAKFAGLAEGDAHVIRNAGGRASDDAIRSLVISYKLLGTQEWFVIHHTNCGMEFFTNEVMQPSRIRGFRMSEKVRDRAQGNSSSGLPSAIRSRACAMMCSVFGSIRWFQRE